MKWILTMTVESTNFMNNPKVYIFLKKLLRACSNPINYHPLAHSIDIDTIFDSESLSLKGINKLPPESRALFRGLAGEQRPFFLKDAYYSTFFNILISEYKDNTFKTDAVVKLKKLWNDIEDEIENSTWGNIYSRWINSKVLHASVCDLQINYLQYSNEQILSCSIYTVAKISHVCMETIEILREMEELNHILSTNNVYYRNPEPKFS